ncbi:MAG: hypothetical protein KME08_16805 [Aphanothece sp. CMT-3BRIN-NPC111]|jgi:hypothetical protein|nr:hypothetical protein [Aphanothece sp. CMT-3BRIN-NPC111]
MSNNIFDLNPDEDACIIQSSRDSRNKLESDPSPLPIQADNSQTDGQASTIDDATLIQKFAQGETSLVANKNLRLGSTGDRLQLTTAKSEIIGLLAWVDKRRVALIKPTSQYWELINEILQKNNFVYWGDSKQKGFVEYQKWVPPSGYKIHYTEAVALWKKWWPTQRYQNQHKFNLNLLIFIKNNWYPLQNITVNEGIFYIKTLVSQLTLSGSEKVVWATELAKQIANLNIDNIDSKPDPATTNLTKTEVYERQIKSEKIYNTLSNNGLESSPQRNIKPETEPVSEYKLKHLNAKAIKNLADYLEEVTQLKLEQASKAEQRALQAEQRAVRERQRAERFAAKLRELGIDPNSL